jgi:hypothetical protein
VIDTGSRVLLRGGAAPSGIRTPAQRAILFVSRIWAWFFLGLLILFFVVAVPLSTGGSVNFFTVRNSQNILVAIIPVLSPPSAARRRSASSTGSSSRN